MTLADIRAEVAKALEPAIAEMKKSSSKTDPSDTEATLQSLATQVADLKQSIEKTPHHLCISDDCQPCQAVRSQAARAVINEMRKIPGVREAHDHYLLMNTMVQVES